MPIEMTCPACQKTLRVADEHAGKQARCPSCQQITTVPLTSAPPSLGGAATPLPFASASAPAQSLLGNSLLWFMRTPEGQVFGPVTRPSLDQWVTEGRITRDCQLRLGEAATWQAAEAIYPQLGGPQLGGPAKNPSNPFGDANPFASSGSTGYTLPSSGSFGGPGAYGGAPQYLKPHRGELILILGILSLVVCQLLGPIPWIMGQADLAEMKRGQMNPQGEGLTRGGMIVGIISTVIVVLFVAFFALICAVGIAGG